MDRIALVALVAAATLIGCEVEPRNYDKCILKYLPGTNDTIVASMIVDACISKYGESKPRK